MALSIKETGAALGAVITGVDLSQPVDDATFQQIHQAFDRYGVICMRGPEFSDEDHIRFSAHFGEVRKLKKNSKDLRTISANEHIVIVSNAVNTEGKPIGSYDSGLFWHTDGAYAAKLCKASLLHAFEVPVQDDGRVLGDTQFSSMTAAYDALPESMKKRIANLQALHSRRKRAEKTAQVGVSSWRLSSDYKKELEAKLTGGAQDIEALHPVVMVHPRTGRKCLYVSDGHTMCIDGLPEDESRDLLAELTTHMIKPEFLYFHNWRAHDLLVWDNISTQHKATFDYKLPLRRVMHRTMVMM